MSHRINQKGQAMHEVKVSPNAEHTAAAACANVINLAERRIEVERRLRYACAIERITLRRLRDAEQDQVIQRIMERFADRSTEAIGEAIQAALAAYIRHGNKEAAFNAACALLNPKAAQVKLYEVRP